MNAVFADTSFYVALLSPRDALHGTAMELLRGCEGRIVTTEQVLTETGNWFAATGNRGAFLVLMESIQKDPATVAVWSDRATFAAGLKLFAARRDKEWSLTDCISFVVMRERRIAQALTADHHFEQAGFEAMLR